MDIEVPQPPPAEPRGRLQALCMEIRERPDIQKMLIMTAIITVFTWTVIGVVIHHRLHDPPHVKLWCIPNSTVSVGGRRGEYPTISQAIEAAPSFSASRYCIHVRAGKYRENVVVGPDKTNLVLVGDGRKKTVLAANRSCGGQYCELQVATLLVNGHGFIAIGLTIENLEDPVSLPTAAVENWSDRSIFYRCGLTSRGGVILANGFRQFYGSNRIRGAGSIISGGAQAYFQGCKITLDGLTGSTVAQQSARDPSDGSGFVFHLCHVGASHYPLQSVPILGSALTPYSRIAYLQCAIRLEAADWSDNGFVSGTVFFAQYGNTKFHNRHTSASSAVVRDLDFASASELSLGGFFVEDWIPAGIDHQRSLSR